MEDKQENHHWFSDLTGNTRDIAGLLFLSWFMFF